MTASDEQMLLIRDLYHAYRHTVEPERKGIYFSPTCMQMCRPIPSYAATTRQQIVQYLKDAQQGKVPVNERPETQNGPEVLDGDEVVTRGSETSRSVYTIRPLLQSEHEFGSDENITPVHLSSQALQHMAKDQEWVGMRVDLWDEGQETAGLLVKVQYWWRRERAEEGEKLPGDVDGFGWRQCMHDIMYLGSRDGTENRTGLKVLE